MLIHDEYGRECHINLDHVVFVRIAYEDDDRPTEHRVEMTNCEYFDVREDEYNKIVKYLDEED